MGCKVLLSELKKLEILQIMGFFPSSCLNNMNGHQIKCLPCATYMGIEVVRERTKFNTFVSQHITKSEIKFKNKLYE